jgi:hypothetical protein
MPPARKSDKKKKAKKERKPPTPETSDASGSESDASESSASEAAAAAPAPAKEYDPRDPRDVWEVANSLKDGTGKVRVNWKFRPKKKTQFNTKYLPTFFKDGDGPEVPAVFFNRAVVLRRLYDPAVGDYGTNDDGSAKGNRPAHWELHTFAKRPLLDMGDGKPTANREGEVRKSIMKTAQSDVKKDRTDGAVSTTTTIDPKFYKTERRSKGEDGQTRITKFEDGAQLTYTFGNFSEIYARTEDGALETRVKVKAKRAGAPPTNLKWGRNMLKFFKEGTVADIAWKPEVIVTGQKTTIRATIVYIAVYLATTGASDSGGHKAVAPRSGRCKVPAHLLKRPDPVTESESDGASGSDDGDDSDAPGSAAESEPATPPPKKKRGKDKKEKGKTSKKAKPEPEPESEGEAEPESPPPKKKRGKDKKGKGKKKAPEPEPESDSESEAESEPATPPPKKKRGKDKKGKADKKGGKKAKKAPEPESDSASEAEESRAALAGGPSDSEASESE